MQKKDKFLYKIIKSNLGQNFILKQSKFRKFSKFRKSKLKNGVIFKLGKCLKIRPKTN